MQHLLCVCFLWWSILQATSLQAQPIPRAEADSLLSLLQVGKADTNRVNQLIRLGEYHVYKTGELKADMDSARTYTKQAQDLSRQLRYYHGETRSINLLGTISREAKELEHSIAYHQAALRLYQQHRDWRGEADSYLLLAWARRDKGEAAEARKEAQKAIALYTEKGYPKGVGQAHIELGNTYANWGGELDTKINFYQQALEWFAKAKDKRRQADVHKDLGDLYSLQGNNAQALLELRKALTLYQTIHYPRLQGVYDLLGTIYTELSDYEEGLKYGLKAVQTAESLKDSTMELCTIYNRLGITYFRLKQYSKAHLYYNKAMLVAQKYNDQPSIILLTGNIAGVLYKLNQPEASLRLLLAMNKRYPPQNLIDSMSSDFHILRSYTQLKEYALAQRYCNQLLSFVANLGKKHNNFEQIYIGIIPFFIASKQHGQAQKYLTEFEEHCTATGYLRGASYAQFWWFQLDSMQANYPSAIRHYQQYKMLEDSLLNEAKNRQIASLDVQYETEKKEKDLKLKEQNIQALTRERQLQAKQSEQDRLMRNALAGGAVLLLLLVGVIYNRYRLKRRSNRQLEVQKRQLQVQQQQIYQKNQDLERLLTEKERLLKEIHHRVKNNLQIVMSLLNSQAASLQDKAALSAIQESQHRVQAMALIHQKLYQSEGIARIPMKAYIEEVVGFLRDSYTLFQRVNFRLAIEPIELDVTLAVPLGLIINEAITNAFKYAFPGDRFGTVSIGLHQESDASYELIIADDGVGLPIGFDPSRSRSLGMTLMHGFSAQLGGELLLECKEGVKLTLLFTDEQLSQIHNKAEYVY